jgi:CheY-like chemotaxis protein
LLEEGIESAFAGTSCAVETKFNAQTNSTMGDSKQLNEVFLNLFINAHQATSDGGIIKIITTNEFVRHNKIANLHEGNYIKITVSDNGVGITEAQLDKLFTPFYTTKQHGNGLGLVTVFSIVNAHAGSVQVESKVGIGTQFHVYLPIRDEIRSMNNTETIDNLDNSKEYKVKVILVDDDKNITEMMTELSKEIDRIELKTFNDPDMAIQYFRMKSTVDPFEVAILDMTLVGFDKSGVDVLNILKEIDPAVKAIIFTGHSSKPIVSNYRDYGFDGKLEKPCNFEQLLDKVNDVFTGRTK